MSQEPMRIFLADLTHDGTGKLAVDMMPYNIGLIASYAKQQLGDAVQISLFKYVQPLLEALKCQPPHILGCSNYVWNSHLSEFACEHAKQINPAIVTVQGGTNYPFDAPSQLAFLSTRPATDLHVYYEGEAAFVNLLKAFQSSPDVRELRERPIDGCQSISPTTGRLVSGAAVARISALGEIPSPYATGLLDQFFDGRLTPIVETNRGCPFTCNFCNAGNSYFSKVNMFPLEHLEAEFSYIAPRMAASGVGLLVLADNNFGMYPRDAELCRILKRLQERHGWPLRILSTTGKNSKDRIIKATEILGTSMSINMSVQSMNQAVLENIRRQNVSLEAYQQINEVLVRQGRVQKAEMIVPLPGETLASFMQGLKELMDTKAQLIYSYTLQLLYGTEYKDAAYRAQWGYQGKWRLVPLNFGAYDGTKIFDVEEVAVASKSLSFDDYVKIRVFALLTETMYNDYQCWEFVKYLNAWGISPFDWLANTAEHLHQAPESVQQIVQSFIRDTQEELWDSEEALFEFYRRPEHYARLLKGEAGHNVVFTHKGLMISRHIEDWVPFIARMCRELVQERVPTANPEAVRKEVHALEQFLLAKFEGVLRKDGNVDDVFVELAYDIPQWLSDSSGKPLGAFARETPMAFRVYFTDAQRKEREQCLRLYGFDRIGLARIFARNPSLNTLYRAVEPAGQAVTIPQRPEWRPAWNN
ncbi:MAG: radical SAM protein [Candidatus Omnitrophica bacterium]|nr:radical SAM protein [Candidatus Omnitrophota bacterium]